MKRRALIKITPELIKQRLMLPGELLDVQVSPDYHSRFGKDSEECDYAVFKLGGGDLPEVSEGEIIPYINIQVDVIENPSKPQLVFRAYWMHEGDDERHFIGETT